MDHVEKSIEVEAPISTVYNQWTQFEEFPRFMEGVESVRQMDDKRLHWRAEIGGKTVEWDAEIFEQIPDRRVAWRSVSGQMNSGMVNFEMIDASRTRVSLKLNYEPEGAMQKIGSAVGVVTARVEGDLKRFKQFIEKRGMETGGWRGRIEGRDVQPASESGTSSMPRSQRQTENSGTPSNLDRAGESLTPNQHS